jgi:hypothetical protein
MKVVDTDHRGVSRVAYVGPSSHFVLWTDEPVAVVQPAANPYAAVLPAAGGSTSFSSREASRENLNSSVDITSDAPARPEEADPSKGCTNPEVGQRGPMIDVLGPTVRFSVHRGARLRMWAAAEEIDDLMPGDSVSISVSTPFALRLIAHPVQREWQDALPQAWTRKAKQALTYGAYGHLATESPYGQDRFFLKEALPPYELRMTNVQSPGRDDWAAFAKRSETNAVIPPMLGMTALDGPDTRWEQHALPPVPPRPEIGVFGRITRFDSTSVGGNAVVGSVSHPIVRGQELRFESDDGLGAGIYHFTPLVSSGQETAEASIFGSASVWVADSVVSHPNWLPWVPFGAVLSALVGFLVAGILRWVREATDSSATGDP